MMKKGFTLIELLVVIAMIALLASSVTISVSNAQKRARISKADAEAHEITNAILAFENYSKDVSLAKYTMEEQEANVSTLGFILGEATGRNGKIPILYNAAADSSGKIRDPWGTPYKVTVRKVEDVTMAGADDMQLKPFVPNWHQLTAGE